MLKLRSEAGSRFGKRVDPELTVKALARAGQLLDELAGGTVRPVYGDIYPGKPQPKTIELDPAYVNRLLGMDVPVDEMVRILRGAGVRGDGGAGGQGDEEQGRFALVSFSPVSASPCPATARTSTSRPTWWKRSAASTATTGCRTR